MDTATSENHVMFFGLYTFIAIVGILANIIVFQAFRRQRIKSYFHTQLALVNIFSLANIIFIGPAALSGKFFFGIRVCRYSAYHAFMFGFAEINLTCLICMECLVAVLKKSNHKQWMSDTTKTVLSVLLWVYAVVFSAGPFFGWGRYYYERLGTSCGIDLNRRVIEEVPYLITAYVIFGVMILGAIVAVGVALCRKQHSYSSLLGPLITDDELVKISTALLCILCICSIPFGIRVLHYIMGTTSPFNSYLGVEFSHFAMKLSCCLHAMAYFVFSQEFQNRVKFVFTSTDGEKKNN